MTLDVPFQSQIDLKRPDENEYIWCSIACLSMVMQYYIKDTAPSATVLRDKFGSSLKAAGFLHKDILNIARTFGLRGFRKSWWTGSQEQELINKFKEEGGTEEDILDWTKTNVDEGIFTIKQMIDQKVPVIVSVSPEFSPSKATHLVVVVGHENNQLVIHDPYKKGANYKISEEEFGDLWLRQAMIIKRRAN